MAPRCGCAAVDVRIYTYVPPVGGCAVRRCELGCQVVGGRRLWWRVQHEGCSVGVSEGCSGVEWKSKRFLGRSWCGRRGLIGSGRRGCTEVGRTARVGQAAPVQVVIYRSVTFLVGR